MSPEESRTILVSACLLGLRTRYDGRSKLSREVLDYLERERLTPIPVCPEQLAGLPTPRPETQFSEGTGVDVIAGRGSVRTRSGNAMNATFLRGAGETARIAGLSGCRSALFKERSPSCGVNEIYRNGEKVAGAGVTTAFLRNAGITVFSEEEIQQGS